MRHTGGQLAFVWFFATALAIAQAAETQQTAADRLIEPAPETAIPLKRLPLDILHDQKTVWTFPGKTIRGQHWKPVLVVGLITAGLVALDPHTEPYFHDNPGFRAYKTGPLRGRNSTLAITITPGSYT